MFVWGDVSDTDWKDGRMDYMSRKHQSEIKSSLKLPRVTYSVLSRVRWLIAKLQVHGFLNKSAYVVQIYSIPWILSDTQRHKPIADVSEVHQKHISVYLFFLCTFAWPMKLFISHNSPELPLCNTECATEQDNWKVKYVTKMRQVKQQEDGLGLGFRGKDNKHIIII